MKKVSAVLIFVFAAFTAFSQASSSQRLARIFNEVKFIDQQLNPNLILWNGFHPDVIYTVEMFEYESIGEKYKSALRKINAIPDANLSHQERISKSIMELKIQDQISQIDYRMFLIPFNAEGGFYNAPTYFLPSLPFDFKEDYEDYLRWLPSFVDYMDHYITLMKYGLEFNILPPKIVVENNIQLLDQWINQDEDENPFMKPLYHLPDSLSAFEKQVLIEDGKNIIKKQIIPAYQRLFIFLQVYYLPQCPTDISVSSLPKGKEYYEDRVAYYATMDISPDSVFNLGQQEVKRIHSKMDKIILDLNFEGDYKDFLYFLRTDPQFYADSAAALLLKAETISRKAESLLPQYFHTLYDLPFVVEAVPDEIAQTYTSGRYVHGDTKKGIAGKYWVNTYSLSSRTLYTLTALTLHEAVPGHHLQTTLASEILGLPEFRNLYYISAFGEGWALYCEYLGEEMGMYESPYDLFGRYTYEMWRACRLVVDVGIHYKGWSREEAVAFLSENTALSIHEVNTEIDRYIGWPGQAISYKIGEIAIKNLREKAEKELGKKFEIKEFHNRILRNGSVPLPILLEEVEFYIKENN